MKRNVYDIYIQINCIVSTDNVDGYEWRILKLMNLWISQTLPYDWDLEYDAILCHLKAHEYLWKSVWTERQKKIEFPLESFDIGQL